MLLVQLHASMIHHLPISVRARHCFTDLCSMMINKKMHHKKNLKIQKLRAIKQLIVNNFTSLSSYRFIDVIREDDLVNNRNAEPNL